MCTNNVILCYNINMINIGYLLSSCAIPILTSGAIAAAAGLYTLYKRHSDQFNDRIPQNLAGRVNQTQYEEKRIARALKSKREVEPLDISQIDKKSLRKLASDVNGSFIHASGNCALLSLVFLYNLLCKCNILSVSNTFPPHNEIISISAERILFNEVLLIHATRLKGLDAVKESILTRFLQNGDRFYVVTTDRCFILPISNLESGHTFNAVVLKNEKGVDYVQFVDAWTTSNQTPETESFKKCFPKDACFNISVPHKNLVKDLSD